MRNQVQSASPIHPTRNTAAQAYPVGYYDYVYPTGYPANTVYHPLPKDKKDEVYPVYLRPKSVQKKKSKKKSQKKKPAAKKGFNGLLEATKKVGVDFTENMIDRQFGFETPQETGNVSMTKNKMQCLMMVSSSSSLPNMVPVCCRNTKNLFKAGDKIVQIV